MTRSKKPMVKRKVASKKPPNPVDHPIAVCATFIAKNMSPRNIEYWQYEARKHEMPLDQMIARYLLKDFGIEEPTIQSLYPTVLTTKKS